ncbi:histidine phosphatase family protein [Paenibacillus sp. PL2-23]|uniref:histidine phosphatase family protein n=1 Tax=Paenibacillus sp. PL2-23 TaxID=2100729 RepID=UPI0030FCB4CA
MKTKIYFVRHAESIYINGQERTRGLSEKGRLQAIRVKEKLISLDIHYILSSPYERAIQTITPLADELQKEIILFEGLTERELGEIGEVNFNEAKHRLYSDFTFQYPDGESSHTAQTRAIHDLHYILRNYKGKSIVIGTHGDIMTLMLSYFDKQYNIEFWKSTTMPDIYQLQFHGTTLEKVQRL